MVRLCLLPFVSPSSFGTQVNGLIYLVSRFITVPFLAHDLKAVEIVQVILESVLLRREKTMLDTDGNKIVELPPKEVSMWFVRFPACLNIFQVIVDYLEFSPLERKIYDSIFFDAKKDFEQLTAKGLVNKNYTHILALLMRYVSPN